MRRILDGSHTVTLPGASPQPGDAAPGFRCIAGAEPYAPCTLADTPARPRLFSVVPSVDTPVCDLQTQRFSREVLALGEGAAGYTVSIDAPYALERHGREACGGAALLGLSDYRPERSFGVAWGVLVEETQELCRAVFVVDAAGIVRYAGIAPNTWEHPDYDAPLAVLRALAAG